MKQPAFKKDPLGAAFYDYYFNHQYHAKVKTISDHGGMDSMPVSMFFRTYREMGKLEQKALKACKGSVLDIGAGAGCHALWLQENNHPVTAIDVSRGAVSVMKERGIKDAREISFFKLNEKPYDTVFMMMNGIGFTGDPEGLEKFFEHVKTLMQDDSKIILDSTDVSYLYSEHGPNLEIDLTSSYYGVFDFMMEYNGIFSDPFYWMYIDYASLAALAEENGFKVEKIYQDESFRYLARLRMK